ncbi:MAG TPA: hypothetical protein VMV45_13815 [Casimicrobiaceae bacterium]|nr:hypothetical protein [Casimicrobiaceae bacterium]
MMANDPAPPPAVAPAASPIPQVPAPAASARAWTRTVWLFAATVLVCLMVYLALAVPESWFPSARELVFGPSDMTVARGTGEVEDGELILKAPDASGNTLVSVNTSFRSSDYPGIAWIAIDLTDATKADLLWRSDYTPGRVNALPLRIESGRLVPIVMKGQPGWIGNITGIALSLRGALPQPVRLRGATASPLGAINLLRDRAHEWLALETWTGTSINTVTGGADVQSLPLPLLLAFAAALAAGVTWVAYRRGWNALAVAPPVAIVTVFLLAWVVLDARWMWNLVRQVEVTGSQYAGKDWHEKHLASEDAPLFAFIEKARAKLPPPPARILVMADEPYFRGRAAYHLYPYNVIYSPYANRLPTADQLRPGDAVLVYQRHGVQYDAQNQVLRWDGTQTRKAKLLMVDHGSALFIVE